GGEPLVPSAQLVVQRDHVLENVGRDPRARSQRRQTQRRERRIALRALQRDLQRRAPARRLGPQQLFDQGVEARGQALQQRQLGLPPAVLQHRQGGGDGPDRF